MNWVQLHLEEHDQLWQLGRDQVSRPVQYELVEQAVLERRRLEEAKMVRRRQWKAFESDQEATLVYGEGALYRCTCVVLPRAVRTSSENE
jgi:hypothetical protein